VYVGSDSSLANFGNVSADDAQLKYSNWSLENADCTSALCGMFGISGLQKKQILQTTVQQPAHKKTRNVLDRKTYQPSGTTIRNAHSVCDNLSQIRVE